MVAEKADILDKEDAQLDTSKKFLGLEEIVDTGEATVHLRDGSSLELHGYDTHFYSPNSFDPYFYTEDENGGDRWVFASEIVQIERH